ncbi:hypothetical protein [Methylibium sp.]
MTCMMPAAAATHRDVLEPNIFHQAGQEFLNMKSMNAAVPQNFSW